MRKFFIISLFAVFVQPSSAQLSFKTNLVKKSGLTTTQGDTIDGKNIFNISAIGILPNGTLADSLWYLTGTGKDTSRVYNLKSGSVQFSIVIDDTSAANDSAGTLLKIYTAQRKQFGGGIPGFATFVFQDSVAFKAGTGSAGVKQDDDVAASGVNGQGRYTYVYTSAGSNRPGHYFWYITLEGVTLVNKPGSAVSNIIEVSYAY